MSTLRAATTTITTKKRLGGQHIEHPRQGLCWESASRQGKPGERGRFHSKGDQSKRMVYRERMEVKFVRASFYAAESVGRWQALDEDQPPCHGSTEPHITTSTRRLHHADWKKGTLPTSALESKR
ncbi:hypothetical protein PspLS_09482 [Pyricularia sp. CBS 133598]|nr:hypothetical protein PspLS_09482 [Pyricularia sp. CBS 133598]